MLDVGFWMLVEIPVGAGFDQHPTSNIQHPF
jgi:hypothetical protein